MPRHVHGSVLSCNEPAGHLDSGMTIHVACLPGAMGHPGVVMAGARRVVVLGASPKTYRYSNLALRSLKEHGHEPVPVNPAHREILGIPVAASLAEVSHPVDTVTLYVSPDRLHDMVGDVLALKPRRIIANPGAECDAMRGAAEAAGVEYLEACTLVLLSIGKF